MTAVVSLAFASQSFALPQGGQVVGGQASIATSGSQTTITQSTQHGIINWQSFDISHGEAVHFQQPSASSVTLNRVTGGQGASQLLGNLTANGTVMLVNPQGTFIGPNANVNVGSFLATTSDIADDRFMAGDYRFDKPGSPDATIMNTGSITVADAGLAALVAPNVVNNGLIQARLGKVQLASGDTFTIDLYGDGLFALEAGPTITSQLVSNGGIIAAEGGKVLLTAAAAGEVVSSLINMDGIISATSIGEQNGEIVIFAEGSNAVAGNDPAMKGQKQGNSTVLVSGVLDASGRGEGERGGKIVVTGDHVGILGNADIDASGAADGGDIRIGGDYLGSGDTPTARRTIVQSGATVRANAIQHGDGGRVIVWSDDRTDFAGRIEAQGGMYGGNGGFVETSGKALLNATGLVDASSPWGTAGLWLLDPNNITIQAAGVNTNVTGSPNFTTTDDSAIVTTSSIQAALNAGTSVTVQTGSGGTNSQLGNITVASAIAKTAGGDATLTLSAANDIFVNAAISSTSNKLHVVLGADADANQSGRISVNQNITSNGGDIILGGSADPTAGFAYGSAFDAGVHIDGRTLNAGAGNITLNGHGTTGSHFGVMLYGSTVLSTTTGSITVNGSGTVGAIRINAWGTPQIVTQDGNILLNGVAGTGQGVSMDGSMVIEATGSGSVSLFGSSSGSSNGIYLYRNPTFRTTSGNINLDATSTTGQAMSVVSTSDGVATFVSTSGNIQLTGNGFTGGLRLLTAPISTGGAGTITIDSRNTGSTQSHEGFTYSGTITAHDGDVSITGATDRWKALNMPNATVNVTGAGNVSLTAVTGSIFGGALSTQTGDITIATTNRSSSLSGSFEGATYYASDAATSSLNSVSGDIRITAGGGGRILTRTNNWVATTGGDIVLGATGGGILDLRANSNPFLTAGGNVAFEANADVNTNLTIQANGFSSTGTFTGAGGGQFAFRQYTPGASVGVGDGGTHDISLTNTLVSGLQPRFSELTFGRTDGGALTNYVGNWTRPVTFLTGQDFTNAVAASSNNRILALAGRDVTLGAAMTTSFSGLNPLTLVAGRNFINNAGAGALSTPSGRWLVYSTNPGNDTIASLGNDFRRFSCTYGGSCPSFPASGNGLLYSHTPTLTATPSAIGLTYGDAGPDLSGYAYTLSGYLGSDSASDSVTGSLTGSTPYTQGDNVGSYAVTYASGSLASALGYGFTYANNATGLTVNQKTLTASLTGTVSKTYDGTTAATLASGNYLLSGIYGADDVGISNTAGSYDTKNVGSGKTVSVNGLALSGSKASNYTLSSTSVNGSTGSISALELTAGLTGTVRKTFNGTTAATLTPANYLLPGVLAGDSVSLNNPTSGSFNNSEVGTGKLVTVTGLALLGADSGNYLLGSPVISANIGQIDSAAPTLTPQEASRIQFIRPSYEPILPSRGDTTSVASPVQFAAEARADDPPANLSPASDGRKQRAKPYRLPLILVDPEAQRLMELPPNL